MNLSVLLCRVCGMALMLPLLFLGTPVSAHAFPSSDYPSLYYPVPHYPSTHYSSPHHQSIAPTSPGSMSSDILRFVNDHRRAIGLKPLQANSFISSVALEHSRNMLSGKTRFGHDGMRQRI